MNWLQFTKEKSSASAPKTMEEKMVKIKVLESDFKDRELFVRVDKLYSKLSKEDLKTLFDWVDSNCETVKGNKCDECGTELEKTHLITISGLPVFSWVCPKSEIYQAYKLDIEKRGNMH